MIIGVHISISASGAPRAFCVRRTYRLPVPRTDVPLSLPGRCGPYGAKHWVSLPTPGLCSDCLRSLTDTLCATHRLCPSRPE
eukprot:7131517-Prymnesium_polylepis.1